MIMATFYGYEDVRFMDLEVHSTCFGSGMMWFEVL